MNLVKPSTNSTMSISQLAKQINSTALKDLPSLLTTHLQFLSSSPSILPSLLSHLHTSHSSSIKLYHTFLFSHSHSLSSALSLSSLLLSLSRSRHFSLSLSLLSRLPPSLLTPSSLSILISRFAKFHPFPATIAFFNQVRDVCALSGVNNNLFDILLRSFAMQGRMAEARAAFNMFHSRFGVGTRSLNVLLLGFKKAGDLSAFELFWNEMVVRGFDPDVVSFNVRIDMYCKRKRFDKGLEVFEEMERKGFVPTIETMTTLVHGAGIVKNVCRARRVFDEISERGLEKDKGAYNALIGAYVKVGEMKEGMELMDEMESKGMGADDVSYYTMICGLKKVDDFEGVLKIFRRMMERNYVPRVRTVMLLMKYFCVTRRSDLGLELWDYLVDKGCCPHMHALDLLLISLCSCKRMEEAYVCFKQVLERERWPSKRSVMMIERALSRVEQNEKLEELQVMMKNLESIKPNRENELEELSYVGDGLKEVA